MLGIDRLKRGFLSLWLQQKCCLCDRLGSEVLCSPCAQQLKRSQIANPVRFWQGDLPVFPWGRYDSDLRRAIAQLKYRDRAQLGLTLGIWLGERWQTTFSQDLVPMVAIPVPLAAEKLQQRGYNQAELIARGFVRLSGIPLETRSLIRTRNTVAQYGLDARARSQNLKDAFAIQGNWRHRQRSVLLIDDIYTTGATARAITETLKRSGIPVAGIATIAIAK